MSLTPIATLGELDVAIRAGGKTSIHVCEKPECRDAHEKEHNHVTL